MAFDNYFVPRENLLNKASDVTKEGQYISFSVRDTLVLNCAIVNDNFYDSLHLGPDQAAWSCSGDSLWRESGYYCHMYITLEISDFHSNTVQQLFVTKM